MHLLQAALFVVVGGFGYVAFLLWAFPNNHSSPLVGWSVALVFLLLLVAAVALFRERPGPSLAELEAQGLVTSTSFRAKRAFQVEGYDGESHYYLDLDDGPVLYLGGECLWDYEPIEDDPELNQPRRFPCTEFTLKRHREQGDVLEVLCGGRVLEPEVFAPGFPDVVRRSSDQPRYGDIIRDRTYDELKQSCLAARRR